MDIETQIRQAKESNANELDLSSNQIINLTPLANLSNLHWLDLSDNQITDLAPLAGLTKLKTLFHADNPIPKEQKEMLGKALPKCRIGFDLANTPQVP